MKEPLFLALHICGKWYSYPLYFKSGQLTQTLQEIDESVPTKSATRPFEGTEIKPFMNIRILI
jgi:hypothetical protein